MITVVICASLGATFSILQIFIIVTSLMTFEIYWILEFLSSLTSSGMIAAGFIYSIERVTAEHRGKINNIYILIDIAMTYSGMSLAAWIFADNFIAFKLVMATSGFLAILMYFAFGESTQWLLTQTSTVKR